MKNIFNIGFVVLVSLMLNSCYNDSTKKENKNDNFQLKEFVSEINANLPKQIDESDYWMIYRIGSIEFCTEASVLCIPKNDVNKKDIKCSYFVMNFNSEVLNSSKGITPLSIQFEIVLSNQQKEKIDINNLKSLKKSEYNDYHNSKSRRAKGEWHCGNEYLINPISNENIIILDKNSKDAEKEYFLNLYKQVSPSEYYQSLSLESECKDQQELIPWLMSKDADDSLHFLIKQEKWYIPGW